MSRFENIIQGPSHDRRASHPLQCIPCGRCCATIEYDRGTEWSVVSKLADEHWWVCPGKPQVRPARMTRTPTSPPNTAVASHPPVTLRHRSSSNVVGESVSPSNNTWISAGCERKRRTLEQRKLELEQDEYAKNITTKSVVCVGCNKEISLDKRSKYYPGLWLKHRGKCPGIEKLKHDKEKGPQFPNGIRPARCNAAIPAVEGDGCADMLQPSPAERYEGHSTATAPEFVRQYESEDPSSEDEEEEESPTHEPFPFPALNSDFYRNQLSYNHSDVWVYRYATEEEINANFFHGQDEPYPRLGTGSRPFQTHLGLQTEGRCETSCCVMKNRVEQTVSYADNFRSTKS